MSTALWGFRFKQIKQTCSSLRDLKKVNQGTNIGLTEILKNNKKFLDFLVIKFTRKSRLIAHANTHLRYSNKTFNAF